MLDELGIPLYSERGPNGGFSLVRGYKMPPLVLSPEEAVAVGLGATLVEEMWGALYRDAARGALAKLENLLPDDQRPGDRLGAPLAGCRRAAAARSWVPSRIPWRRCDSALRETRRVSLIYEALGRAEPTCREFDPYTLVFRWGHWYAAGFCHLRDAMRVLRVDRIREVVYAGGEVYDHPRRVTTRAPSWMPRLQPAAGGARPAALRPAAAGFVRDASIGWSGDRGAAGWLPGSHPARR